MDVFVRTMTSVFTVGETMKLALSDLESALAVMVTEPVLSAVAVPPLTAATVGSDDVHVTAAASIELPNASRTAAVNVRESPIDATLCTFGETVTVAATCFTTTVDVAV